LDHRATDRRQANALGIGRCRAGACGFHSLDVKIEQLATKPAGQRSQLLVVRVRAGADALNVVTDRTLNDKLP
jgi:hypothetical protein